MRSTTRPHPCRRVCPTTVALALLAVLALPACAGEGLYLNWNDCPNGAAATAIESFNCASNLGSSTLIAAFSVSQPVDSVIGIEAVIDVQVAVDSLPQWWQFAQGGCSAGMLLAQENFTQNPACTDPWKDSGGALIQNYLPGQPRGALSQARIEAVVSVPSSGFVRLDPGTVYYGVRLILSHQQTPDCTGCAAPACLVLNSIWVKRVPGALGGDLLLVTPGDLGANQARWQSGTGADCSAVPARRTTWGRLRAIYRP